MAEIKGKIFDIKQMAVFDGPGVRTTVFLKGCPLRCKWCHNPEGLSYETEIMVSDNGCLHCDKCKEVCDNPDNCVVCGKCIKACPGHLRRIAGKQVGTEELAAKLLKDKIIYEMNEGGVTLSGGEPTSQPEFILELLKILGNEGVHRAIETCGYCKPEIFKRVLDNVDYVLMDIKMIDKEKHLYWTGKDNGMILENLEQLKASGKPFVIRIPLIPGVNDDSENKEATARLLADATVRKGGHLERVEFMPYHQTAGAKYHMVGREYTPEFDTNQKPDTSTGVFEKYDIPVKVM